MNIEFGKNIGRLIAGGAMIGAVIGPSSGRVLAQEQIDEDGHRFHIESHCDVYTNHENEEDGQEDRHSVLVVTGDNLIAGEQYEILVRNIPRGTSIVDEAAIGHRRYLVRVYHKSVGNMRGERMFLRPGETHEVSVSHNGQELTNRSVVVPVC